MKWIIPSVNYHSSFCQESFWYYQLRSLLTGLPASSLAPYCTLFSTQQLGQSFSITSQIMLLLFPKPHRGFHLTQVTSQSPYSGPQARPPSPLCSHLLQFWVLWPLYCSSDLLRMLSLEASPLHSSTSNLSPWSLLRCHQPPYLKLQPIPKPHPSTSPSLWPNFTIFRPWH